jgi:hypothetical protein
MSDAFIVNRRLNTYGAQVSALVEMLVAAGWTYRASGDGLSGYSATGKVFTNTNAGALGWGNNRAWARVRDPGDRREITIQRDASNGVRIKVSTNLRFVTGSPSATVTPSAADERVLFGTGTDASPVPTPWIDTNALIEGLWIWQGAAFGSAPYGFWFGGQGLHGGTKTGFLMMDPVLSVPSDPDPVVWEVGTNFACTASTSSLGRDGSNVATWNTAPGSAQGCWAHLDPQAASFVYVQPATYGFGQSGNVITYAPVGPATSFAGWNPFDRDLDALPVLYVRERMAASIYPWGMKGWSTMTMWTSVLKQSFFDTLDAKNWICFGQKWLRWNGLSNPIG